MYYANWLTARQFTTLEPGMPLVHEIEFLKNTTAIRARMLQEDYKLKLRARERRRFWRTGLEQCVCLMVQTAIEVGIRG